MPRSFGVVPASTISLALALSTPLWAQSNVWTADLTMTVKRVSTVVPSPDGSMVTFVVSEAVMDGEKSEWLSHVHIANADGSGGRQLTRGDKSATLPRWSPDGRWIGFITSRSGTANVWRISVSGGEAEQITDEKGGVTAFDWSPDSASIAFLMPDPKLDEEEKAAKEKRDWRTVDENLKMKRLYVQPIDRVANRPPSRKLTTMSYSVEDFDWAHDSRQIVFHHQPTPSPTMWPGADISIVAVDSGEVRSLVATRASERTPRFSRDGSRIAFVTSDDPVTWASSDTVAVVATAGGAPIRLAETPDAQPAIVGWTSDQSGVLVAEYSRTLPTVYVLPITGRPSLPLTATKTHIGTPSLNRLGTHLGFVSQDFDKAPEAFVARVTGDFTATKASRVQPNIGAPVGRSDVLSWKASDGQLVEGILTYPVDYQKATRVPLVVIIHGGPSGVFANTFLGAATQYPVAVFASRGYAVLRVNPRGSSGYGRAFRYANMRDWGGGDYNDVMTGVDRVIAMGLADSDRLGVMGWSYGGFMTSWIVTQTNRFRAASAGAAVTNLISFTGTTDIPDFVPSYFAGEFWNVFESWRAHSPVLNARAVKTPTLIQHGEADVRVPVSQSYELYNTLKRQGAVTKLTVYPRQGHAFTEPKMLLDVATANLNWFDRYVKGVTAVTRAK